MYNAMETCCSRFTAAEGGARLAAAAGEKNILVVEYASFISTRLVHEDAYKIRGPLSSGRQRSVYVSRASRVAVVAHELRVMTDLKVLQALQPDQRWADELEINEVLVSTSEVLRSILETGALGMAQINVLIVDSCHLVYTDENLQFIMKLYKQSPENSRPRILALTYPLFSSPKKETPPEQDSEANDDISSKTDGETDHGELGQIGPVVAPGEDGQIGESEQVEDEKPANTCAEVGVYENLDDFAMYEKLEWKIEELERELCCEMDFAEDIDGGKRLAGSLSKPKELIIEFSSRASVEGLPEAYVELDTFMRDAINDAMEFINEHRYDPTEIYGEDLYEEFKNIPDPTIEPKLIFKQFLYVLDQLGPYAADKAAFSLLAKLEKLKIKVPYERHFILLCLCTSVLVKIRCYADLVFSKCDSDWQKIKQFCTPKVLRFAEILQKFQPDCARNTSESITRMLNDLDKCDFTTLGNKIEDKVNIYEANLKEIEVDVKKCDSVTIEGVTNETDSANCDSAKNKDSADPEVRTDGVGRAGGLSRRTGTRGRGRGRGGRGAARPAPQTPDALCGLVFMQDPLMAKIMFMLIVDMSRAHPSLSHLCAQYCAVEAPADPVTDAKEAQRQAKKQEEVLKKFRMHECNLLLATAALEEGIDLPRCNLVLRWDVPQSYRSYGLCRGRARAARSSCGVLCGGDSATGDLLHNLAVYREIDQIISRKCGCGVQDEPPSSEEDHADAFSLVIKPYTPQEHPIQDPIQAKNETDDSEDKNDSPENELDSSRNGKDNFENGKDSPENEIDSNDITNNINKQNDSQKTVKEIDSNDIKNRTDMQNDSQSTENEIDSNNSMNKTDKQNDSQRKDKNQRDIINDSHDKSVKDIENDILKLNIEQEVAIKDVNLSIDSNEKNKIEIENKFETQKTDEIHSDIKNGFVSNIEDKLKDLSLNLSDNQCETKEHLLENTQNHSENVTDSPKVRENRQSDSVKDNLVCNRCNNMKHSISVECTCVKSEVSETKDRTDSKLERDKKIVDSELASVDLSTAIALINRYCGKLPSDTFTRLAPQWWMEEVRLPAPGAEARRAFVCTLRLPLNCPVKYNIVGHPMPTRVLARRMVALQACRILHKSGELDNQLMPIGKENFKAAELDAGNNFVTDAADADAARPGTTKRRQYYFKRTAWAFTDCQPIVDTSDSEIDPPTGDPVENPPRHIEPEPVKKGTKRNMLYAIVSKLWCALPERYNTRGRRLHAPQHASQAIGILMARLQPDDLQIPSFPVYTRSGEVRVSVEHVPDADVRVSPRRTRLIRRFMRFVFAHVLRVRRRGMKLQSEGSTHNNYYVVPTIKTTREDGSTKIDIDWAFLELIYQHTEEKKNCEVEKPLLWQHDEDDDDEPVEKVEKEKERGGCAKVMENPLLKPGETFVFDAEKYREAVVTPWYRNQDQPQFFLVAEICWNLSPESAFPSSAHTSFREYYKNKYGVTLTQQKQPLLDVDHTSARLNLLTPRYVNRKGVALPVSSERTRRAKRDRLDQKQILVPELCRVHPFAAPLWFATVALPCVLYRINALLIADEIRRAVAIDVGLGIPKIDESTCPGFRWPPLDFGWSLAEVLSADSEKGDKKKDESDSSKREDKDRRSPREESEREKADEQKTSEPTEKTINDILAEKEEASESGFEIGTWSNEMASSIPDSEYDEYMEPLPSNLTFCTSASGGSHWCDPIEKPKSQYNANRAFSMAESDCSYMSSDFDTDDSDLNSDSDDDTESGGFWSKNSMGVRIEYKTAHEAEAVDVEKKKKTKPQPLPDPADDARDHRAYRDFIAAGQAPDEYIEKFRTSVTEHRNDILTNGNLIKATQAITDILPETKDHRPQTINKPYSEIIEELFPYGDEELVTNNGQITLESIERNKRKLLEKLKKSLPETEIKKLNCFSMVDVDIDSPNYVNEKVINVGFDTKDSYVEKISKWDSVKEYKPYYQDGRSQGKEFDFDYQPSLEGHPGPSPSVILQALTMSNANDGINLERLETVGDSFLKFAITAYLYCAHPTVHEGKLSHMRSKQVSNLNLYRLGRGRRLGARMIASKFEPHDNWLPPCHRPPNTHAPPNAHSESREQKREMTPAQDNTGCFIPYNLITQHSIPDKSIADCVEALIGAYLLECGPRGALVFMSWLGIRVLPRHDLPLPPDHPYVTARGEEARKPSPPSSPRPPRAPADSDTEDSSDSEAPRHEEELAPERDWSRGPRPVGSLRPHQQAGAWYQTIYGELKAPPSPLLRYIEDPEGELEQMLSGYDELERTLRYRFKDRSLLLQALTHASHQRNRLTDCYQRLEFLGDAILDYLITRHLYEDARRHSPGALTDLRSALVNNTIFATLAAKHGFHKYFRHMSPGLNEVLTRYVKIQEENGHSISEEHYLIQEDEMEQAEDVEVPKALGDLFESVAGAIFLDSGMSLGAVWGVYGALMGAELEAFSAAAPKSPVRELLEAEPDTAKFGKPERLADGRRVRVCVEVFGRGAFKGVGRNYRIAKGTAARCALRHLRATRPR